jgi:hypothetical protein
MTRQIALAAFLICLAGAAGAQAPLPEPYPDPPCNKPQVNMIRPPTDQTHRVDVRTQNDSEAVNSYNSKIRKFNTDSTAYNACMHAYIDKANGDVKTVQEKANADLKQISEHANASMKAIQDKIRTAVAEANSVTLAMDEQAAKLRKK